MLFASLFASVARTFAPSGGAKMGRQDELCFLLGVPSDLVVAGLLPHLQDSRDIASCERTSTLHTVSFCNFRPPNIWALAVLILIIMRGGCVQEASTR